jgi:hypothetical protein
LPLVKHALDQVAYAMSLWSREISSLDIPEVA